MRPDVWMAPGVGRLHGCDEDEEDVSPDAVPSWFEGVLRLAEQYRDEDRSVNVKPERPIDRIARDLARALPYPARGDSLSTEDPPASERGELRGQVKEVLQNNDISWEDKLDVIMEALESLGVETAQHFSLIKTCELQEAGVSVVAARVLMRAFAPFNEEKPSMSLGYPETEASCIDFGEAGDQCRKKPGGESPSILGVEDEHEGDKNVLNSISADRQESADPQERELREKIREVLKKHDINSEEDVSNVMKILKKLGVKTTNHFKHLKTDELRSEGIPLVTARILKGEFGPGFVGPENENGPETESKKNGFWEKLLAFLDSPYFQVVICIVEVIIRYFVNKQHVPKGTEGHLAEDILSCLQKPAGAPTSLFMG